VAVSEFDIYKDRYREEVQKAIAFTGTDVDYCTELKAMALLEICRRHLGDSRDLEVLDVGCGVGMTDSYLASEFRSLWGVDLSAESVEVAARRNPGVSYRAYEGDTLPFPDGRFDVAFAICVLHHVSPADRQRFVREIRRVVRPGGLTVVFEHNPFNPLTRIAVKRCPFDAGVVLLTRKHTAKLFAGAGLDVIDGRYILFFPVRSRILRAVEHVLHRVPLGGQYYVVGRPGVRPGAPPARSVA
jgi:SAM-dependent methyltransferase